MKVEQLLAVLLSGALPGCREVAEAPDQAWTIRRPASRKIAVSWGRP